MIIFRAFVPKSSMFRIGFAALLILGLGAPARATDYTLNDLTLVRIRAVGDYQSGDTFDNTVELWFSESIAGRAGPSCTDGRRVFIHARHYQMVTAAYTALLKGKKVSVNIDDTLPIRYGACEISFLDITSS